MIPPASSRRTRRRRGATAVAILVALVGLLGAIIQAGWIPPPRQWFGTDPSPTATEPACPRAICLDPTSGPVGTLIAVRGTGFAAGENIMLRLGEDEIGSAHTDSAGGFVTSVTVPRSYAGRGRIELTLSALGQTSERIQSAIFTLTTQ